MTNTEEDWDVYIGKDIEGNFIMLKDDAETHLLTISFHNDFADFCDDKKREMAMDMLRAAGLFGEAEGIH